MTDGLFRLTRLGMLLWLCGYSPVSLYPFSSGIVNLGGRATGIVGRAGWRARCAQPPPLRSGEWFASLRLVLTRRRSVIAGLPALLANR